MEHKLTRSPWSGGKQRTQKGGAGNHRAQNETTRSLSSGGTRRADTKTTRSLSSEETQVVREHQTKEGLTSDKAQGALTESPSHGKKQQVREQGNDGIGGRSGAMEGALENTSRRTESRLSGEAPTTPTPIDGKTELSLGTPENHLAATCPIGDGPSRASGRDQQRARSGLHVTATNTAEEAQQRKDSLRCDRLPRT